MKILQWVQANGKQDFFVLDTMPKMVYHREKDIITGTDGIFYSCFYHYEDPYAKAFAGRPFQLLLDTGEIVECRGDWWDGSYPNIPMGLAPCNTIEGLKKCYVYIGYYADKKAFEKELLRPYTGSIIEYFKYEKMLKAL